MYNFTSGPAILYGNVSLFKQPAIISPHTITKYQHYTPTKVKPEFYKVHAFFEQSLWYFGQNLEVK